MRFILFLFLILLLAGCDESSSGDKAVSCSADEPCKAGFFCDTTQEKPICITDYCHANSDVCGVGTCTPDTTAQKYNCDCGTTADLSEDQTTCIKKSPCELHDCGAGTCTVSEDKAVCSCEEHAELDSEKNICIKKTACERHDCGAGSCSEVEEAAVCQCSSTALLNETTNICETVERQYAYDVMAMSWHATFCSDSRFSGLPECLNPTESSKTKLILHGMWPTDSHHSSLYYCDVSDELKAKDAQYWLPENRLPEPDVDAKTSLMILEWMPGTMSDLDRHEWVKHGTCSGLTQDQYYDRMIDFAQNVVPDALNNELNQAGLEGREINRSELIELIQSNTDMVFKLDCTGGKLIEVQFMVPRENIPVNLSNINPNGDCGTTFTVAHF